MFKMLNKKQKDPTILLVSSCISLISDFNALMSYLKYKNKMLGTYRIQFYHYLNNQICQSISFVNKALSILSRPNRKQYQNLKFVWGMYLNLVLEV